MKQSTCDDCSLSWDRKFNVKDIVLCPLHAAAPDLLAALEEATEALEWASGAPSFNPDGMAHKGWKKLGGSAIQLARAAIKKAKGS